MSNWHWYLTAALAFYAVVACDALLASLNGNMAGVETTLTVALVVSTLQLVVIAGGYWYQRGSHA